MDELTNPAENCTRFAPILYDHDEPYCILASKHARMDHCCDTVAGSKANIIDNCYPWCSIIPRADANDTSPPPPGDVIDRFYQCLIDGDDGALPDGMSCSTELQKRSAGSRLQSSGSLKTKMAAGLGVLIATAFLYG